LNRPKGSPLALFPLCAAIAVAMVVGVIAFSPWVVRNQVDLLVRGEPNFLPEVSTRTGSPEEWKGRILWRHGGPSNEQLLRDLGEYLRVHPDDVQAHAIVLRFALAGTPIKMPSGTEPVASEPPLPQWEQALESAAAGARLEPENAFFPFYEAAILWGSGERGQALDRLEAAARATRFDDYALSEGDLLIRFYEGQRGYRGEYPRALIDAAIILPHFSSMRAFALALAESEEPRHLSSRGDFLRVSYLLMRDSPFLIGLMVGGTSAATAITGRRNVGSFMEYDQLVPEARAMDVRLAALGEGQDASARPLAESLIVGSHEIFGKPREWPIEDFDRIGFLYPISAWLLLSLCFGAVFGLVRAGVRRWDPPSIPSLPNAMLQGLLVLLFALIGAALAGTAYWALALGRDAPGASFSVVVATAWILTVVALGFLGRRRPIEWGAYGVVLVLLATGYAAASAAVVREDRSWAVFRIGWRSEADRFRSETTIFDADPPRPSITDRIP
jgi:hypothetical protein